MHIDKPYLLFLGDAPDALAAKVAQGIRDWCPGDCVGQLRLEGCNADVGLQDMSIGEARSAGAETVVIGVANRGGVIAENWLVALEAALRAGMDLASGLHNRLRDVERLVEVAGCEGRRLIDVRDPGETYPVANGKKRRGKRLLPVGTDCSCGKMYTALAISRAMSERGIANDFRATGQTGIFIAGAGVPVDAVVADFISGSVEVLCPEAADDHWDIVEGQGSLFHPSYAGVSTGLLHGAQSDALVLCHEPTRTHMRGLPHYPIPSIEECMQANLAVARLTNPDVRFAGLCINTHELGEEQAERLLGESADRFGLPCVDPVRTGVAPIVDELARW